MAWEPAYATVSDLRAYRRVGDSIDDSQMADNLEAASRDVDHLTNRQFGVVASAEERTYEARWSRRNGRYVVVMDDLSTTTGFVVTVNGTAVDSANYTLLPRNATQTGKPYERIMLKTVTTPNDGGVSTVLLEGVWGWASVPQTIKNATMLQAYHLLSRRDAPFGVAGSPELGSELRLLDKVDPDVRTMLRTYRRDYPFV